MKDIERFVSGFKSFQKGYLGTDSEQFESFQQGQSPRTMIIGCCDSRVDPAILTNCSLGDLFTVRNVANLVPPFEDNSGRHGVSAALEFAVCHLKIEHIVVLGHSQCSGIKALMADDFDCKSGKFISSWMSIATQVRENILNELAGKDPQLQHRAAEQAAILLSLENLHSFPFIADRVAAGKLSLHGWYFDLATGELLEYRPKLGVFQTISDRTHRL